MKFIEGYYGLYPVCTKQELFEIIKLAHKSKEYDDIVKWMLLPANYFNAKLAYEQAGDNLDLFIQKYREIKERRRKEYMQFVNKSLICKN